MDIDNLTVGKLIACLEDFDDALPVRFVLTAWDGRAYRSDPDAAATLESEYQNENVLVISTDALAER